MKSSLCMVSRMACTCMSVLSAHRLNMQVVDTNPLSISKDGALDDLSQVEKFEIAEEEYEKRTDTFRKFKQSHISRFQTAGQSSKEPAPAAEVHHKVVFCSHVRLTFSDRRSLQGISR